MQEHDVITRIPFFENMDFKAMRKLSKVFVRRTYEAGDTVVEEGKASEGFHIIVSGRVRLTARNAAVAAATGLGDDGGPLPGGMFANAGASSAAGNSAVGSGPGSAAGAGASAAGAGAGGGAGAVAVGSDEIELHSLGKGDYFGDLILVASAGQQALEAAAAAGLTGTGSGSGPKHKRAKSGGGGGGGHVDRKYAASPPIPVVAATPPSMHMSGTSSIHGRSSAAGAAVATAMTGASSAAGGGAKGRGGGSSDTSPAAALEPVTVRAIEKSVVLSISAANFKQFCLDNPSVCTAARAACRAAVAHD
jgi:CRP-like cAMP-binding protein